MKKCLIAVLLAATMLGPGRALAAEVDLSKLPPPSDKKGLTYDKDIRPIIEASCIRCHGQDRPKAGLRLDTHAGILKGSKDGKVVIEGQSAKSPVVVAVARLDPETAMPPVRRPGQFGRGGPGNRPAGGPDSPAPGGEAQKNSPGQRQGPGPGGFGPPPKPLTPEQVGLIRAWIDQGAQ